jgi:hypothetical protein
MGLTAVHAQKPFIDSLAMRKQQESLEKAMTKMEKAQKRLKKMQKDLNRDIDKNRLSTEAITKAREQIQKQ